MPVSPGCLHPSGTASEKSPVDANEEWKGVWVFICLMFLGDVERQ